MRRLSNIVLFALLAALVLPSCARRNVRPVTDLSATDPDSGEALMPETVPEFVFGPGDEIDISVWRHEDLNMQIVISPDGAISYPLVGRLHIAGMTYPDLMAMLSTRISEYYKDPQVSVNISKVSSMKVYVLGYVRNPAILQIESELDVMGALTKVGWLTEDSRTNNILLIRGGLEEPELFTIDIEQLLATGDMRQNVPLQKGDILFVPPKTIVNVENFFRRITGMLSPFVSGTVIYRNVTTGNPVGASGALD
jgi:polysaccharide biosynthesis/export protein